MKNYYYIGTILPDLSFDAMPEMSLHDLNDLLRDNLSPHDFKLTETARHLFDISNIRSIWLGEELDPWGNLDENELEEALLNLEGLPDFVYEFLAAYDKKEDRLTHFPQLIATFFQKASKELPKGFLRDYLNFEKELRLVFIPFRAKKLKRDLARELQYEDPEDDLIVQLLSQKDAKEYEPPEKYHDLKVIFEKYADDPLNLRKAIDQYRFNTIENMVDMTDVFSINRILAFMAQLMIVQKWFELDTKRGIEIVDKIVKEAS